MAIRATMWGMVVTVVAAFVATVILGILAFFQLLLAAGAPFGRMAWGGRQPPVLPPPLRVVSSFGAFILATFLIAVLARAGIVRGFLPAEVVGPVTWGIAGMLGLAAVAKLTSRGRAERLVMAPLTAVASVATALVAAFA
mgnify:CR=1 FL=1